MKKRQIGKSDLYVSEISLGCMSLGTDEKKAKSIIDRAIDAGVNYLDTADLYDFGANEKIVGKAIQGRREDLIIGSKAGNNFTQGQEGWTWDPSKKHIKRAVKDSLQRLGTDYIDLYQLHGGTIDDPMDETIEAFDELKQDGLIREYGISSIRPNVIREYVNRSNISSVMMQYNALDRRPEEEILDLLSENDISVLARGPLAKGMLSSKGHHKASQKAEDGFLDYSQEEILALTEKWQDYGSDARTPTALALQYVLHHPAVATAVFGASSVEQVEDNLSYLEADPLTEQIFSEIQTMTRPITYQKHRS
ncbi:aldo/keto reductase [Halobacillus halophilus]|uniref:Aldo/keto reductase family protein n=1 Tax=Halobacillus halophilus (strain ATCC 35676 / DSM 2266 / JCM 20832 / KCTC 3685 / LMG 17431 / NBRC 102448 / NCIMB 2269) TaxID=866895 RepID=I0JNI7_HALH3|nr:aldo/keto reductase [Halobacillus halophilus]ASF39766.1 aldo/keto reductase [Halobacillus halophilus]CCG45707.1 aldo/keto reductase family protein [Halobacillus halophilus DSM 2266]